MGLWSGLLSPARGIVGPVGIAMKATSRAWSGESKKLWPAPGGGRNTSFGLGCEESDTGMNPGEY